MTIPDIGPLPADLAAAADDVIDAVLAIAAREVSLTGHQLDEALRSAWAQLARERPAVHALAVLRLKETGNDEMVAVATLEVRQ